MPYILSLGLKRFEYDWERDARVKVDDRVEFPTELDMAQFLDLDEEEPAPAPAGEEEQEAGEGTEAGEGSAEGGERAASPNGFGREGRGLCAMDAAAVRERGGELAYELFAVLIHSGSAIGGHYYCYCKDVSRHDTAGIWVAFFSRCQAISLLTGRG